MLTQNRFAIFLCLPLAGLGSPALATNTTPGQKSETQDIAVTPQTVYVYGQRIVQPMMQPMAGMGIGFGSTYLESPGGKMSSLAQASPSAENSKPDECGANPTTSNPVIIATGEKYKHEADFSSLGLYGISLTRTYRSFDTITNSMFGPKWFSSLGTPIFPNFHNCVTMDERCVPVGVTFSDVDGSRLIYYLDLERTRNNGGANPVYTVAGSAAFGELTYQPGLFWTLRKGGEAYEYADNGDIRYYEDGKGTLLTYAYNAGRISQITNSATGKSVSLRWGANGRVTAITDPAGNIWTYEYNAKTMLSKVIPPGDSPNVREYHYEDLDPTFLTGISINGRRYSRYSYYPNKLVKQSALEDGQEVDKFVYGTNQTTVADARGKTTTYLFKSIAGELKLTGVSQAGTSTCPAASAATGYDVNGYLDYRLDWNGNKTKYIYDTAGQLLQVTSAADTPAALTAKYSWSSDKIDDVEYRDASNAAYRRVSYTYLNGRPNYPASETVTDLTTGAQRKIGYDYVFNSNGTLAKRTTTGLSGQQSVFTEDFDALGNLISTTNSLGHTDYWSEFDGLGRAWRHVDANGVATRYTYDSNGALTSMIDVTGGITKWTYAPDGQIDTVAAPTGRVIRYKYTQSGHLSAVGNAQGEYVNIAVDMPANARRVSSPRMTPHLNGNIPAPSANGEFSANTVYDSLGRTYAQRGNNGQVLNTRYDNNSNLKSVTDAAERVSQYTYDAQNRPKTFIAADGGETVMTYDAAGRLYSLRDPRGLTTTYAYNGFGDKVSSTSPDTGTTSYTYDGVGQLETETFADGRVVIYAWDALGRLRSKSTGGSINTYGYDEGAYGKGRLTRIQDRTGETTYDYNHAGALLRQTNVVFGKVFNTTWTYDAAGRKEGMTYPSGLMLKYTYDAFGRLSAIKGNGLR